MNERLQKIQALQAHLGMMPQGEMEVNHYFVPGLYIREMVIPAGSLIVGKIHATEHLNVVRKGRCVVATVDGVEEYSQGDSYLSKAGIQKVGLMYEDVIWQNIHVTDKTDLDEIEKEVIAESYEMLPQDIQLRLGVAS